MNEAIDSRERHGVIGKNIVQSPKGWFEVTSRLRRS